MNKLLIQEVGFGGTFDDVRTKLANLSYHLERKNNEEAKLELSNLFFSIYSNIEKIDVKSRVFLCFVKSINEVEFINPEDETEVANALQKLSSLTVGDVQSVIEDLKKKLTAN